MTPDSGLDDPLRPWARWSPDPPTGKLLKAWTGYLGLALHAWGKAGVQREHHIRRCEVIMDTEGCDLATAVALLADRDKAARAAQLAAAEAARQVADAEYRAKCERAAALLARLDGTDRNRWICLQRLSGRTRRDVAHEAGLSMARVQQIEERQRQRARAWDRRRARHSRIVDPGGPRDVWLDFYPPKDPREP